MNYDDAVAAGAMALFGEKYDDEVRVLRIGDFSTELCGGTHVSRAGDIGLFKIVSEGGVAAGVRRIEAVTGEGALDYVAETEDRLRDVAGLVRGTRDDVEDKVRQLIERGRALEKELRAAQGQARQRPGHGPRRGAVEIGGVKVVATSVEGADAAALRNAVDQLKDRLSSAVIVLGVGGRGRQGHADRRRHRRCHLEGEGRRRRQLRGAAGRRPRRRTARHRAGRRHRFGPLAGGPGIRGRLGAGAHRRLSSGPIGPRWRVTHWTPREVFSDSADFFRVRGYLCRYAAVSNSHWQFAGAQAAKRDPIQQTRKQAWHRPVASGVSRPVWND